ncbi:MAG: hypothetical protein ACE5JS_10245 [Nitrospinota bacterium]
MKILTAGIGVFLAASLIGCAPSKDPKEGGLIGGIYGLSSGAYKKRKKEREERLARLKELQRELEAEKTRLQATKRTEEQQIAEYERKLDVLRNGTKRLNQEVAELGRTLTGGHKELAELRKRLARLDQEFRKLDEAKEKEDLNREVLEEKAASLEKEYRELLKLYLELGQ